MFYAKDHKTYDMFDNFAYLGPKRRTLLEESWAKIFREEILPVLPVEKLEKHYDEIMGRPTKELYAMLGLMVLQHMDDLTDEQAVEQFAFNIKWHFALNITGISDAVSYVCPKTIWTMRDIIGENNLYAAVFEAVTQKLAKAFSVDTSRQRLDSVHIFSNMRHLGRIGLFAKTIKKFLENLKRHYRDHYNAIDKEITERYMKKEGEAAFSMVKPSESAKTLETVGKDLFYLTERFRKESAITSMSSYLLLTRVLKEQCLVEEDKETGVSKVSVKANKEVPSDSLQNPSDPDAGYDGHKGKGYQVQVMETYTREEEKDQLSLITYVSVEAAHKSDAHAIIPAIEDTKERGLAPTEILADTLYGSDENCEKAREQGVEIVSPVTGRGKETSVTLNDFTLTQSGEVKSCPEGHRPEQTRKDEAGRLTAAMKTETCESCTKTADCPVKAGKKFHYLHYDEKAIRLAARRAIEKTDEFKNRYRFRSGVEGTMSQYDRKTGVKQLRVRGMTAVSLAAVLKATGINILRASAFKNRANRDDSPSNRGNIADINLNFDLTGILSMVRNYFESFCERFAAKNQVGFQIYA